MSCWSLVPALNFGRLLNSIYHKTFFSIQSWDPALLRGYYWFPSNLNPVELDTYVKYVNHLKKLMKPNTENIYPSSVEEFQNGLWQSSARLIVVFQMICSASRKSWFPCEFSLCDTSGTNSLNWADAIDKSNGNVFHEALRLFGVVDPNGSNGNGSHTCTGDVSDDSNSFYCLPLTTECQDTVELIQSRLSHPLKVIDSSLLAQPNSLPAGFSWQDYKSHLQTRYLGRMLVWARSMGSSWSLCEVLLDNLPPSSGLLVTSSVQTGGRGRGSNRWITPLGQAAFTFHLTANMALTSFDSHSDFMGHVVCMQHIVSLGIVLTCKRLIGEQLSLLSADPSPLNEEYVMDLCYQGPEVRIKWPNDVYVVDSKSMESSADAIVENNGWSVLGKLAGVITRASTSVPQKVDILVGCGININNSDPTICLSEVIDRCRAAQAGPNTKPTELSIANVIAMFMNQLEHLIDRICSSPSGLTWAILLYTKCWIHSDQIVEVIPGPDEAKTSPYRCRILGLDNFGYLKVMDLQDESVYSLHPDGNSLDMMRGLVRPK